MFKNTGEIKKAVSEGKEVFWKNPAYQVKTFSNGTFIYCQMNGHMIALETMSGELNGNINDFYMGE